MVMRISAPQAGGTAVRTVPAARPRGATELEAATTACTEPHRHGVSRRPVALVEPVTVLRVALARLLGECPALDLVVRVGTWTELADWASRQRGLGLPRVVVTRTTIAAEMAVKQANELDGLLGSVTCVCCGSSVRVPRLPRAWTARGLQEDQSPSALFAACGVTGECRCAAKTAQASELTEDEHLVYLGIAKNKKMAEIAFAMGKTMAGVNGLRRRAFAKLGLKNNGDLLRHAAAVGLTPCYWGCGTPCRAATLKS